MPAAFIGHGSPMNAIEESPFRRRWAETASRMARPRAVLCVSAHWETRGVSVTGSEAPPTIHDFYGFPPELFAVRYPAPGDPALARRTAAIVRSAPVAIDDDRGLDHGAWSVLVAMYPEADVPVVQLSLDTRQTPAFHYALAKELAPLRDEGVLVLGSGNMVHNLRVVDFRLPGGYDWANRFDDLLKVLIRARDHAALASYETLGPDARLAIPTPEHYLPLLYVLALQADDEEVSLFNDETVLGSVSMTSLGIGSARY